MLVDQDADICFLASNWIADSVFIKFLLVPPKNYHHSYLCQIWSVDSLSLVRLSHCVHRRLGWMCDLGHNWNYPCQTTKNTSIIIISLKSEHIIPFIINNMLTQPRIKLCSHCGRVQTGLQARVVIRGLWWEKSTAFFWKKFFFDMFLWDAYSTVFLWPNFSQAPFICWYSFCKGPDINFFQPQTLSSLWQVHSIEHQVVIAHV